MQFWIWRVDFGYAGRVVDSKTQAYVHVVAPNDISEVLRLAVQNPPKPVPNTDAYYDYIIVGIERLQQITAQWKPIYQGPRPATAVEEALAELDRMLVEK